MCGQWFAITVNCCSSKIDADKLGEEENDGISLAESTGIFLFFCSKKKNPLTVQSNFGFKVGNCKLVCENTSTWIIYF